MNWRKAAFWVLIGWIAFPLNQLGMFVGDIAHYDESEEERKERHKWDADGVV